MRQKPESTLAVQYQLELGHGQSQSTTFHIYEHLREESIKAYINNSHARMLECVDVSVASWVYGCNPLCVFVSQPVAKSQ